jgi:hypothetical protein
VVPPPKKTPAPPAAIPQELMLQKLAAESAIRLGMPPRPEDVAAVKAAGLELDPRIVPNGVLAPDAPKSNPRSGRHGTCTGGPGARGQEGAQAAHSQGQEHRHGPRGEHRGRGRVARDGCGREPTDREQHAGGEGSDHPHPACATAGRGPPR